MKTIFRRYRVASIFVLYRPIDRIPMTILNRKQAYQSHSDERIYVLSTLENPETQIPYSDVLSQWH